MYVMIEKSINYQMLPNSLFKSQTARIDFVLESSDKLKKYKLVQNPNMSENQTLSKINSKEC